MNKLKKTTILFFGFILIPFTESFANKLTLEEKGELGNVKELQESLMVGTLAKGLVVACPVTQEEKRITKTWILSQTWSQFDILNLTTDLRNKKGINEENMMYNHLFSMKENVKIEKFKWIKHLFGPPIFWKNSSKLDLSYRKGKREHTGELKEFPRVYNARSRYMTPKVYCTKSTKGDFEMYECAGGKNISREMVDLVLQCKFHYFIKKNIF